MMRGVASTLEKHHRVQVLDEALEAAVKLSHRYIPARQLPDKAVSLLDTACARVAISQHAVPAEVEDCRSRIEALETELAIIGREQAVGMRRRRARRRGATRSCSTETQAARRAARRAGTTEKALVDEILALRAQLRGDGSRSTARGSRRSGRDREAPAPRAASAACRADERADAARASCTTLQAELAKLQGEKPLILPTRRRAGGRLGGRRLDRHPRRPHGEGRDRDRAQAGRHARPARDRPGPRAGDDRPAHPDLARRPRRTRSKPIGVFMLAGPSGVGKTETALALAEALYGGEQNLITINMSEFQEAHTVSTLKGAPPGYVGYGEGGVLTEAVRRRPYSVVLLDEVEKAHPDVHEIFFQVFDKGVHGGRRGPPHRLQEHADPADVQRRHRPDHQHVQGPGADARARRASPRRCASRC